jgi:DNA-binding response OmpR family regulator
MAKWRVMVVDDEEDVRRIIGVALKPKYEVVEAHDGLDGLEKLERYEPDFIIMDVMMPLVSGFEACEIIRKNPKFREVPVLFLSALSAKEDIKKGYGVGATLYLTKPFDPMRLVKNVDMYFEEHTVSQYTKRLSIEEIDALQKSAAAEKAGTTSDEITRPAEAPRKVPHYAKGAPDSAPTQSLRGEKEEYMRYTQPRVIVVDDDPNILEIVSLALTDRFEVVKARDGMEAIEKVVRYQPDLMVLDIMLPKMSGYQLCQSIRRNKTFASMPIIVISAKSAQKDKDYAMRVGASEYLVKPFEPQQLISSIESFISHPQFKVREKAMAYHEIAAIEEMPMFDKGEEKYLRKKEESELERFIREEMKDEQGDTRPDDRPDS